MKSKKPKMSCSATKECLLKLGELMEHAEQTAVSCPEVIMSQSGASLCPLVLLVLLGGAMASAIFKKENDHELIVNMLGLKEKEVGGKPLFGSVIKSINTSCQRKVLVMNATLNVYSKIFSTVLQTEQHGRAGVHLLDKLKSELERKKVRSALESLKQEMEEQSRHLGQLNLDREDVLSKLGDIKVEDTLDQRKALAEFKEVYQAIDVSYPKCRHAHSSSAQ
uniref:Uncharacterized protein n=2 Tax=Gasterosteus aculeatus aculeatus TaxID=481459 RepID=A0AAQ4QPC5_GASAC